MKPAEHARDASERSEREPAPPEGHEARAAYAATDLAEPGALEPAAAALLPWVLRHGHDAVAFQGLEPGLRAWLDVGPGARARAAVAYADTGAAWIGAGGPHAPIGERADVAGRFAAAARAAGRRASFFCVDDDPRWPGFTRVLLGEQPVWEPASWPAVVRAHRRLREQLRRAKAKGVRVRRVGADELREGAPLRVAVEELSAAWLSSRAMEPMGFLVTLAPFVAAAEHRYFVAERGGQAVAFLSLVPVPARDGWLFEDLLRHGAPNGTSELLIDAAMRELIVDGARYATTGLAPLTGGVPRWMRAIGVVSRPLYDFRGLRAFKQRLHPTRWERVWMCSPQGESAAWHVLQALRAFAPGGMIGFALRTTVRHPGVLAWMLGVPLVPWTALLGALAVTGHAGRLGFSALALAVWVVFDGILALGLWRASRQPTPRLLSLLAAAATLDASLSVHHLLSAGVGAGWELALRALAVAAPLLGAPALWWAAHRARTLARRARGAPPAACSTTPPGV